MDKMTSQFIGTEGSNTSVDHSISNLHRKYWGGIILFLLPTLMVGVLLFGYFIQYFASNSIEVQSQKISDKVFIKKVRVADPKGAHILVQLAEFGYPSELVAMSQKLDIGTYENVTIPLLSQEELRKHGAKSYVLEHGIELFVSLRRDDELTKEKKIDPILLGSFGKPVIQKITVL